jgi:exosortase/archaeosortase family protein
MAATGFAPNLHQIPPVLHPPAAAAARRPATLAGMDDIGGPTLWQRLRRPSTLVFIGAGLLAADPLRWLVATWTDATYNREGLYVALAVALLAAWSGASALRREVPDARRALGLLIAAAAVRAAGQLLRVNVLGALTLAVDVYALATLAGLAHRRRAVSPGWLAALFALSLPLERVLQRVLGYGLQQLSATGACSALGLLDLEVVCQGTRILLDGQDLLVDLPCSGARGLVLLLTLFCGACAVARPDALRAARGLALTLLSAWAANVLRLVALALGLARGVPVMEAPWHELTGLVALALGAAPVLWWARRANRAEAFDFALPIAARPLCDRDLRYRASRGLPLLFVAAALVIVNLPARPVDVARAMAPPVLPAALGQWTANPLPLSAAEQAYFTRYGGAAARASYGPHGLLLVSTSAPLRHLHAPDECLRNAGHDVRYVGVRRGALPSALYRSVDADGRRWRIAVSYVASDGAWATSVAEAVWRWLRGGRGAVTWTMVQRITPWDVAEPELADWDHAVARALDLPARPGAEETLHRTPDFT